MPDEQALAEVFANWATQLAPNAVPEPVRQILESSVIDLLGLCVAARHSDYVRSLLASADGKGKCSVVGHEVALDAAGAALINGTAAHGEDYDDTFEGTPVHSGAVIVPAVLAAAEAYELSGRDVLRGMAVGIELMCRLALVAPTAIHRAGFHPTGVIGALGAAAAVATALKLNSTQTASALGIAGSFASGIIEYLAEGTWSKRIHPGWAAQSGLRAARMAQAGFLGPRTVFEGAHGFFHAFAEESIPRNLSQITDRLGDHWWAASIAYKPYACGTMAQPFIDCALKLRRDRLDLDTVEAITCKVGEGTVHRLWEPLVEKTSPPNSYAAKFSVPYCIAIALIDGAAGLQQFTETRVQDPQVRKLAATINYQIDPENEYPQNYSGHIRLQTKDGHSREAVQPHLRGGQREPLTRREIVAKMRANLMYGGWLESRAAEVEEFCATLFDRDDLHCLQQFR